MYQLQDPSTRLAKCLLCEREMHDSRVTSHLTACIRRTLGLNMKERSKGLHKPVTPGDLCHVKVYTFDRFYHVAHILVPADGTMNELDQAIQAAWAQPCCGEQHHARFHGGDHLFDDHEDPYHTAMTTSLVQAWEGVKDYLWYDLPPYIAAKVEHYGLFSGEAKWIPPVLAQNILLPQTCAGGCGRRATMVRHIPIQMFARATKRRYLCRECALMDGESYRPILNSPFTGACQYGVGTPYNIDTTGVSC